MAYTAIDDPSAYFQTTLYTGAGAGQTVTNGGNSDLKPDFLWIKRRNAGYGHVVVDSNRGLGSSNPPYLATEATDAENSNQNWISGVGTDGFTIGINEQNLSNTSGTYVAWQWKANGGTTASNTDGDINSTVQVNQDAGFSIVTYTGNGSTSDQTIGHGLGVRANAVIVKNRDAAVNWVVWSEGVDANHSLELNTTDGISDSTQGRVLSNAGSRGTSTIFSIRSGSGSVVQTNTSGEDYVAYCFAEKQGYSKFSSYKGNGNADGTFVYTGFKPAFVMIKKTSTNNWLIYDHKRSGYNPKQDKLYPDSASAEDASTASVDLLSNGFKLRASSASQNASGGTYIYMAFAENPFVTSTGIPTTAR